MILIQYSWLVLETLTILSRVFYNNFATSTYCYEICVFNLIIFHEEWRTVSMSFRQNKASLVTHIIKNTECTWTQRTPRAEFQIPQWTGCVVHPSICHADSEDSFLSCSRLSHVIGFVQDDESNLNVDVMWKTNAVHEWMFLRFGGFQFKYHFCSSNSFCSV